VPPRATLGISPGSLHRQRVRMIAFLLLFVPLPLTQLFSSHILPRQLTRVSLTSSAPKTCLEMKMLTLRSSRLIWECSENINCECMEFGNAAMIDEESDHIKLEYLCALRSSDSELPFYVWRKIVKAYYSRQLTYGTDMPPALAGIARKF